MLTYKPLTSDTWQDFEKLFGPRGACGGCWCMYWRLSRSQFEAQKGDENRHSLHKLVDSGKTPGLLAYRDGNPSGWCCVAPRGEFPTLKRSRLLKPVDDQPVWSVVCFFVARQERHQGLTVGLLKAVVNFASSHGAQIIEGYPVEPKAGKSPDVFVYTGLLSAFQNAGFTEVARRSPTRPIMRFTV